MITKRKISIYKKYDCDNDNLVRSGNIKEKNEISDEDWQLIDSLLQDIELVKRGLTTEKFARDLEFRLKENIENESVLNGLKKMIKK
jgi:hypothetical protein